MARVSKYIEIDAPKEHVFALAADVTRQPDWTTFVKEVIITSGDGKSAGTTERRKMKVGPRATNGDGVWTLYDPGKVFARKTTSGMPMTERISVMPAGDGSRVEWTVEYEPPMGPVGKFMDLFMMNRVFQNEIEGSLANLKAALEV